MQTTTGAGDNNYGYRNKVEARAAWEQASHENCSFCCDCCACHKCACCILILWIISGLWGAVNSYTLIQAIDDGEWVTGCPDTYSSYVDCCTSADYSDDSSDPFAQLVFLDVTCEQLQSAETINMVNDILVAVAGIAGLAAIAMFIWYLMLVPFGYSIISIILSIVAMVTLGFGIFVSWIGVALSVLIVVLFFINTKLMYEYRLQ